MESNAATNWRRNQKLRVILLLLTCVFGFLSDSGKADTAKNAFMTFQNSFAQEICREELGHSSEFRLLFAVPEFRAFLGAKPETAFFRAALATWSSDLLVKIVLQIEQDITPHCPASPALDSATLETKRAYLDRVGVVPDKLTASEIDLRFRGLLVPKSDLAMVQGKIKSVPAQLTGLEFLRKVYGTELEMVLGVLVASPEKRFITDLTRQVQELCPEVEGCRFWNPKFIYRAVITTRPAMAAYIPEVGVLFLSDQLFTQNKLLHRIVILHELTHVGEKTTLALYGRSWKKEFSGFSGWRLMRGKWQASVVKKKTRHDLLTQESQGSGFSVLPDTIYVAGKKLDGFVFAKSYEQSLARNDPGEDLADSVAAFRYFPGRFCLDGKAFAPHKYDWIRANLFPAAPQLSCR